MKNLTIIAVLAAAVLVIDPDAWRWRRRQNEKERISKAFTAGVNSEREAAKMRAAS